MFCIKEHPITVPFQRSAEAKYDESSPSERVYKDALLAISKGSIYKYTKIIDILLKNGIKCFVSTGGSFQDYHEYIQYQPMYDQEVDSGEIDSSVSRFLSSSGKAKDDVVLVDGEFLKVMLLQLNEGEEYGFSTFDEVVAYMDICLARNLPVGIKSSCFSVDYWVGYSDKFKENRIRRLVDWQKKNNVEYIFNIDEHLAASPQNLDLLKRLFCRNKIYFFRYVCQDEIARSILGSDYSLKIYQCVITGGMKSFAKMDIHHLHFVSQSVLHENAHFLSGESFTGDLSVASSEADADVRDATRGELQGKDLTLMGFAVDSISIPARDDDLNAKLVAPDYVMLASEPARLASYKHFVIGASSFETTFVVLSQCICYAHSIELDLRGLSNEDAAWFGSRVNRSVEEPFSLFSPEYGVLTSLTVNVAFDLGSGDELVEDKVSNIYSAINAFLKLISWRAKNLCTVRLNIKLAGELMEPIREACWRHMFKKYLEIIADNGCTSRVIVSYEGDGGPIHLYDSLGSDESVAKQSAVADGAAATDLKRAQELPTCPTGTKRLKTDVVCGEYSDEARVFSSSAASAGAGVGAGVGVGVGTECVDALMLLDAQCALDPVLTLNLEISDV